MTKFKQVGQSLGRTNFKHWLLKAELGRLIGIFARAPKKVECVAIPNPFLVIELCAGNGRDTLASGTSSPHIIENHARFADENGVDMKVICIEKDENTFHHLRSNVDHNLVDVIHGDARDYVLRPTCAKQAIFVHVDPNTINDMPYTKAFRDSLTPATTYLCTLGCNAGGIKRMSRETRDQWREYVYLMIEDLPQWHDAIIVRLENDASQWAYLLRVPNKWSRETQLRIEKKGASIWTPGVKVASVRTDWRSFERTLDRLFLTVSELEAS